MRRLAFNLLCAQSAVFAAIWFLSWFCQVSFEGPLPLTRAVSVNAMSQSGHIVLAAWSPGYQDRRLRLDSYQEDAFDGLPKRPIAWVDFPASGRLRGWLVGVDLWLLFALSSAWPLMRVVRRKEA